jgi:OOP family OmpA-OmpF porin
MRYLIIPFLILISITSDAVAASYMGIGIGSATFTLDLTSAGGSTLDNSGTGSKLYGGYSFNKYFAAEASIYNFAEVSVGSVEYPPASGTFHSGSASMRGIGAYAVAMYPVTKKVNLLAKLGALSWNADVSEDNNSETNSGTDAAYGLAASYAFTKTLLAVAEWESYNTDNPELSMFSVGFKFIFK